LAFYLYRLLRVLPTRVSYHISAAMSSIIFTLPRYS
jgi:hypothetical protein